MGVAENEEEEQSTRATEQIGRENELGMRILVVGDRISAEMGDWEGGISK